MIRLPRSLFGRLLATAILALLAALTIAGFAIGHVLERFVIEGLDDRLDAQIAVVARAVRADGGLDRTLAIDVPPFDRAGSGWQWQVIAPRGTLGSRSLGGAALVPAFLPHHHGLDAVDGRPRPFEARDARGAPLHGRLLIVPTGGGPVEILAAAPRATVERPLRAAAVPLLGSLLLLGGALALAVLVQLRLGLRPLRRIAAMLGDVRDGRGDHVTIDEPTELLPMVSALNALIDANQAALARARGHVANLAHGLKTPLAALRLDLAGRDEAGVLAAHLARIEDQVRHHLGRARAASSAGLATPSVAVAGMVTDLAQALGRIHADRGVGIDAIIDPALHVRCDPQDLAELLGNLLDNGWRHARARVTVTARAIDRRIEIVIEDDGPGIPEHHLARAAAPGERIDEAGEGHGFGLPIARELAELHGGALSLRNADAGGLAVTVTLPRGHAIKEGGPGNPGPPS